MTMPETDRKIIERISKKGTDNYVGLPRFYLQFSYPVSLEISEWIGAKAYREGFTDPLEFLCLMANKFYTSINSPSDNILESFILNEGKSIEDKTRNLILSVKKWETNEKSNDELADAVTDFCQKTYGVRLPMASFFLRMLLPGKFGTVDVRCISALKLLGFRIKELPPENTKKDDYIRKYNGSDYLEYNKLLTEIGKHYQMPSKFGGHRHMTPSEIDMALYEYNKKAAEPEIPIDTAAKLSANEDKIQRIMSIAEEIVKGTRTGPWWVKRAGENFLQNMKRYAEGNDLDSIFSYCTRLARGTKGKEIARWLQSKQLPSIESEYGKIKSIYQD